jgi:hypothetical protein
VRPAFEVETFEYVEAGPGLALLRLAGAWRPAPPAGEVELVAVSAGDRVPLAPLPAGPPKAGDRLWRAAYSLSPRLLGAAFELDPTHGAPIPLPAPVEHGAAPEREPDPAPDPAPEPEQTAGRRFRRGRRPEPAPEPEPDSHAEALEAVRKELEVVRRTLAAELDVVRRQLDATQHKLDTADRHIDTVNEAHALELGSARTQRNRANERSERLESALRDAREEIGSLRERLADREGLVERARAEASHGAQESAELEAAATRLHDAIAARAREAAASPPRRFSREAPSPSPTPELERAREELRAGAERIEALERQAEALREAIRSGLPPSVEPSPLQEVLPLDP